MESRLVQLSIKERIKVVLFDVDKYNIKDLKKLTDNELLERAVKAEKEENFDYQQYQDPLFEGYPSVVVYDNLNEFQESLELEAVNIDYYYVFFVAVE